MSYKDDKNESPDRDHEHDQKNEGSTLYVSNLSSKITTSRLQDIFEKFGKIEKCYVISNPITRESRNFGFVTFNSSEDAQSALIKSNKMEIEGRIINVEIAKRNEPHEPTPGEYKGVQNMLNKHGGRPNYRGRYDKPYDRRRYEYRRYNPYYKDRSKDFSRNNYRNNFDRYRRNKYYEHRHFDGRSNDRRSDDKRSDDRRSNDSRDRHYKKNDNYRKIDKNNDDDKYCNNKFDKKTRKMKYDRARKSSSDSRSDRRHYRDTPTERSPRYKRK